MPFKSRQSDPPSGDARRFRAMIEHSWDVIKLISADGIILYASPAAERVLGYDPEKLRGEPVAPYLHLDDANSVLDHFSHIREVPGGEPVTLTYRCRCADGKWCWMEGVFTNLLHEPDIGAIVLNERDITERKLAQADRDQLLLSEQTARAQAEAASRAKDNFLSIVSHELRTPLTPVLLCVSDLQRDPSLSERALEELAMIREQVELEAQIVDDLLDLTRIGQGRLHLRRELIDVHDVIRETLQAAPREIRDKRLELRQELKASSHVIAADPRRLRQVLLNLLSNAAKFTPASGSITIRTSNRVDDAGASSASAAGERAWLVIEVTDTGVGLRPDILSRLFQPFEQAEQSLTRRFGGLGLGLTIARELVALQGGTITASSPGPDRGATFALAFPAATLPAAAQAGAAAATLAGAQRHLHILLVEDNPTTLNAMARLLQHAGHHIVTANTVDAALRALEDQEVDLLVCDLGLPDGSGWELLRRASAIRTLPAIALSGFSSDADIDRSRRAGFAAHLVKPVTPQKLHDAIRQATSPPPPPVAPSGPGLGPSGK